MQTINSYIYDNSILVQYTTDADIGTRNRVVYTRTIKCYQGVDNLLKVKIQNQDQKPYDVTDKVLVFSVIDDYVHANGTVIFQTNVTVSNASAGIGTVLIPMENINGWARTNYTYSIWVEDGGYNFPTYVDDNWGAQGQIQVIPSAYPQFTSNTVITGVEDLGTL